MKKKTIRRSLSLLCSLALILSLAIPAFAAEYQSSTSSTTVGGVTYSYYSSLYTDPGKWAGTWLKTVGNINVPDGTMAAQAFLFNANGESLRSSSMVPNYGSTYFTYAETSGVSATLTVYSMGKVKLPDGSGSYVINGAPKTESRSASSCNTVIATLTATLDSNGNYPTNLAGQTYGSMLLANTVGDEPDLISAVGENDTHGYIRASDTAIQFGSPEEARAFLEAAGGNYMIPLYNRNGFVIGSYKMDIMV